MVRIRLRIRILGSVVLINGSARPKNIRFRIRNTGTVTQFFTDKNCYKDKKQEKSRAGYGSGCGSGGPKTYGSNVSGCESDLQYATDIHCRTHLEIVLYDTRAGTYTLDPY
jgi:hypothetical protein